MEEEFIGVLDSIINSIKAGETEEAISTLEELKKIVSDVYAGSIGASLN